MSKPVFNEITVRLIREPNSVSLYHVMYGKVCILKLVSVPSDDDIKTALNNYRSQSTTQDSAMVTQLRGKHRSGAWNGNDDDFPPPPKAAA